MVNPFSAETDCQPAVLLFFVALSPSVEMLLLVFAKFQTLPIGLRSFSSYKKIHPDKFPF
jgi:hypothetical protein